MNDTVDSVVPVTVEDREAALWMGRNVLRWTPKQIQTVEELRGDDAPLVQAFARHRIEAIAAERERADRLAEENSANAELYEAVKKIAGGLLDERAPHRAHAMARIARAALAAHEATR